jgi:hypothetical protein
MLKEIRQLKEHSRMQDKVIAELKKQSKAPWEPRSNNGNNVHFNL